MTRMLLQGQRLNVAEKKFQGLWKNRTDRQKNIRFPSEYGYYKYRFENQFFCLLVVFWASSWWKFNETFTNNKSVNEKNIFLKNFLSLKGFMSSLNLWCFKIKKPKNGRQLQTKNYNKHYSKQNIKIAFKNKRFNLNTS